MAARGNRVKMAILALANGDKCELKLLSRAQARHLAFATTTHTSPAVEP